MTWTMENTEGFTQADLDMINKLRATILDGFKGQPESVDDAINNVWRDGMDRETLGRRVYDALLA